MDEMDYGFIVIISILGLILIGYMSSIIYTYISLDLNRDCFEKIAKEQCKEINKVFDGEMSIFNYNSIIFYCKESKRRQTDGIKFKFLKEDWEKCVR